MFRRTLIGIGLAALLAGCDGVEEAGDMVPEADRAKSSAGPDRTGQKQIVAFGDSLTAGFGIGLDEAYPAVLQQLVDEAGYAYEVINAGVSGETSAGGLRRLDWVLENRDVEILILAIGGNDGLRGLPPPEMKKNLAGIIEGAEAHGVKVLLAGFTASPEHQDRYIEDFVSVYPELAEEHGVTLLPFLLERVAGVRELNQPDGTHPDAAGARVVAENVWELLEPMLSQPQVSPAP